MKITKKTINNNRTETIESVTNYDHYIAVDWSQKTMSIARISSKQPDKVKIRTTDTNITELKEQLQSLKGKRILTIEESSPAHWLYVELHDCVERIIICDPYKNKLINDGPKNDPIDARKLCLLLKGGFLREVYHTTEQIYGLRKLVSGYLDIIQMGVRLKNQRAGFLSQTGKPKTTKELPTAATDRFMQEILNSFIETYEKTREDYQQLFMERCKDDKRLRCLKSVPGIGEVLAVQILAITIDACRFKTIGKYLAYCGLVKYSKESGGKTYGRRNSRYSRVLKAAYKIAASSAINGNNPMHEYYESMLQKGMPDYNARHKVARYIARTCFGIMKQPKKYQPYLWREKKIDNE